MAAAAVAQYYLVVSILHHEQFCCSGGNVFGGTRVLIWEWPVFFRCCKMLQWNTEDNNNSRDGTGRDWTITELNGTFFWRHWDTTGLLGTEFRYHGIARDGLYILWDCTGRHAENDFTRYLYGTQEAHCFLLYYKEINIHWYNVPLHLAYSSHLRAAALTTVVLTKRNDYTSLSRWQRLPSKLKLKMFMKISFY